MQLYEPHGEQLTAFEIVVVGDRFGRKKYKFGKFTTEAAEREHPKFNSD